MGGTILDIKDTTSFKTRRNKNKKKAWRTKIDITDIEDAQRQKSNEENAKDFATDKNSDEAFTFDFEDILDTPNRVIESIQTELPTRKKTTEKRLRCHIYLDGLVGAKPVMKDQPIVRQALSKTMRAVKKQTGDSEREKKNKRLADANQTRAKKYSNFLARKQYLQTTGDLWKEKSMFKGQKLGQGDNEHKAYIEKGFQHYLRVTKQPKLTPRGRFYKPSDIPSVIVPNPGAAYNPSLEDHQELLRVALRKEKIRLAREKTQKAKCAAIVAYVKGKPLKTKEEQSAQIKQTQTHKTEKSVKKAPEISLAPKKSMRNITVTTVKGDTKPAQSKTPKRKTAQPKPTKKVQPKPAKAKTVQPEATITDSDQPEPAQPPKKKEAAKKLKKTQTESQPEEGPSEEITVTAVRVQTKPKTQKQRSEAARKRTRRLNILKRQTTKKQQSKVDKADSILKKIKKHENRIETRLEDKKREDFIADRYKTKRFHSKMFKEDDLHAPLGDELSGSIRAIKPIENGFHDMLQSMRRRNMIEVSQGKRKRASVRKSFKNRARRGVDHLLEPKK